MLKYMLDTNMCIYTIKNVTSTPHVELIALQCRQERYTMPEYACLGSNSYLHHTGNEHEPSCRGAH